MTELEKMLPPERSMPESKAGRIRHRVVVWAEANPGVEVVDRSSRRLRTAPRLAMGAAAATVSAAVVATLVVTSGETAFAGWTATPVAMDAEKLAELGDDCATRVADAFPGAPAGMSPVVGERRGSSSLALIASGSTVALCADWLGEHSGDVQIGNTFEGITSGVSLDQGARIELIGAPGAGDADDESGLRIAYGLAAADVASVRIVAGDGTRLTASVRDGYFLGWWPSAAEVESVTALDKAGAVLQKVSPSAFDDEEAPHQR